MIHPFIHFWRHLGLLSRLMLAIAVVIIATSAAMIIVQVGHEQADAVVRARSTVHEIQVVIEPAVVEQAIVGDYAHIRQLLHSQVVERPDLQDLEWRYRGVSIHAADPAPMTIKAPRWFAAWINASALQSTHAIQFAGEDYGKLSISLNPAVEINSIWEGFKRLFQFTVFALISIWVLSYFILRRNLIVLDRLVVAVDAMKRGEYDVRVRESGAPELRTLVRAFNDGNKRFGVLIDELHQREIQQTAQLDLITAQNFAYQEQRRAMDAAAIIAETDLAGNILLVNDKFCNVSGYAREELLGSNHRILNSGMHTVSLFSNMWQTIGRGVIWQGEICNRARNGSLYWVHTTIIPILDEVTLLPKRYQAIHFDITERKQAEEAVWRVSHQLQDILAAASEVAVIATDTQGVITLFNTGAEYMLGYKAEALLGQASPILFHLPEEVARRGQELSLELNREISGFDVLVAMSNIEGRERREWVYVCKDGSHVMVSLGVTTIRDMDGNVTGYLGIALDITERKLLEDELHLEKERAEVTLASIGDAVMTTDVDGKVTFLNEIAERLTGWTMDEAIGMPVTQVFNIVNETTRQPGVNPVTEVVRERRVVGMSDNTVLISRKGIEHNVEDSAAPIFMSDGVLVGCVLVFHDVTEKHRLMTAVHWQAGHDTLTNLPNRALLNDRFVRALAGARRNNTLTVVCLLDLDEFKPINDVFGHEAGDEVLVEVAHRLSRAVRGEDTVARLGGDEFVLLMNEFDDMNEVEAMIGRVLTMVSAPYRIGNEIVKINASIGMTLYPLDDADPDTLLRHADQAMYQAKQAGRNRYHLFDLASDIEAQTSLRKIERVRQALIGEELCLYYQPKVNMRSGKVVGMEALLRWQHPEHGIIPPLEFLPLIEQTSLIVEIGEWVITRALEQISNWLTLGKEWVVSVNIAGLHFQRSDFCDRLSTILAAHPRVPPRLLQIEILESATLGDLGYAHDMVVSCQKLGVTFALDDFGTGYSSLTYLKRLPANVLKIDQSFVRDMLMDKEGMALVEAVISLATVFGSEVVAEGVESSEHGVLLMRLGCNFGQGYGIAHPMPAANVIDWARQYTPDASWAMWSNVHWELSDFPLLVAQYDHLSWVKKVVASVYDTPLTLPRAELIDHHQCRFGHWYYGLGRKRYGQLPEYIALEKVHTEVHRVGMKIVHLYAQGDKEAAKALTGELMQLKDKILISLSNLQRSVAAKLH
ncbi:MAG: EAL domain-containing protein [Sulfuriferula sp.]|nr:EAL domain-containing protein [Sulfuriferula sp.]